MKKYIFILLVLSWINISFGVSSSRVKFGEFSGALKQYNNNLLLDLKAQLHKARENQKLLNQLSTDFINSSNREKRRLNNSVLALIEYNSQYNQNILDKIKEIINQVNNDTNKIAKLIEQAENNI